MKSIILVLFLAITSISKAQAISATLDNSATFEGKTVTLCEKVTSTHVTKSGNILLNFGKPYPNNSFTVVIFPNDSAKFTYNPSETLKDKVICVTGIVKMYNGKPEIIVSKEDEIVIK